ncbi:AAA family ATPase [Nocardia sp. NPDC051030]|uniref:AAA family ATPase n=1 Tax=Nocardia sp. NPDC051030 TaxID=3155162 RepID=UPI0034204198
MFVLWLTGAPGVGKSTVGWGLYGRARAEGVAVAYVDIDQLGILVPAPVGDSDRHQLKAINVLRVLETFRRYGVEQVIVSGVVDPDRGIERVRDALGTGVGLVRLCCSREELRRRYLGRGSPEELVDRLMAVADALECNGIGAPFDTTAMSPDEVVEKLAEQMKPGRAEVIPLASELAGPVAGEGLPVLVLVGPTAVGKSAVGWEVLQLLRGRGIPAAYIDVEQLGFCSGELAPMVKGENLLQVWRGYREAGARALIVVARGAPDRYETALAGELVRTVYLEASPGVLAERIALRGHGRGPRLAGDSLVGASPLRQAGLVVRAAEEAGGLRENRGGAWVIDTDERTIAAVAGELLLGLL